MPPTRDLPATLAERLPLPSLRMYAAASTALLSAALYYASNVTKDPNWRNNSTTTAPQPPLPPEELPVAPDRNTLLDRGTEVAAFMLHEPLCIWTVINMAYCLLALLGTQIQRAVFGPLRVSEAQHVKDKFWNFVFYKFIFVFGVINVQYMDEVLLWCSWFTVLGFLHLLAQLCKDRFEYLSFSATPRRWSHARLLALLLGVLSLSAALLGVCVVVGLDAGLNTFAFMAAECVLLMTSTLNVLVQYALHLYDARATEGDSQSGWERRAAFGYYVQLIFHMWSLTLELAHHIHMLLWSNIFLSMASLVILMQLRYLFHEIQARLRKHRMYLWVANHMSTNYPMATREELAENSDNCAICWEKMETARKLPCAHLFHNSCLTSWLQQDTSCPTCRRTLPSWGAPPHRRAPAARVDADVAPPRRNNNHFFHFDGSRYVSWLPSFSVEVTSVRVNNQQQTTSQLDAMARQVQQLFPHYPLSTITMDLRTTRSIELTIDNILDGRLQAPPIFAADQPEAASSATTSSATTPESPPTEATTSATHPATQTVQLTTQTVQPATPATQPATIEMDEPTLAVVAGGRSVLEEWDEQDSREAEASAGSSRFSKNSAERERILKRRKERLLELARRRYQT